MSREVGTRLHHHRIGQGILAGILIGTMVLVIGAPAASAAATPINLGTAGAYAVLAGQGVTNTGPSVVDGSLGSSPNGAMTGFPPGIVTGPVHPADAQALQAQSDLTTAYNAAAGQTGTAILPQLGGTTLTPGVYNGGALDLTGDLTLDGPGVYIITASSSLTTATGSSVNLINGANPCDVFWQVSSSANLLGASFSGTIMALTSITAGDGVIVNGRLLARNGDVTLINDVINRPACGGVVHTPGISVTKTCPASAKIGDTITYRITVVNTGDEPLSGLTVSDPLISPLPLRGFPSTLPVGASAPRTFTYVVTGPPGTIHNVVTAQAMGASSGAAASGTSSCDTAATATRLRPPKANFIGPCGEPYYAALFTNNTSAAVTFTWSFVSYYSHDIIRITRTVAAGEEFQTSFHHVLASTRMRITAGGKILASIRSAPSGNYGPCPNGAAPVSAQGERDGQI